MKAEGMTDEVGRMDGMGDLVEFLLACFAEDKEFALRYPPTAAARPRALAECEAKRRIMELATGAVYRLADAVGDEWGGYDDTDADEELLRALALPYADHPDFREEWRA